MKRSALVLRAVLVLSLAGGLCAIPRLSAAFRGLSAHDCCSRPAQPRDRVCKTGGDCCLRAPLPDKPAVKATQTLSTALPQEAPAAADFQPASPFVEIQLSPPQIAVPLLSRDRAPPA